MPGGIPGGSVVKNPPANAGDTGSTPGPGRSRMLQSNCWAWELQLQSPHATAAEACAAAARALQQEKPLQQEARSLNCKKSSLPLAAAREKTQNSHKYVSKLRICWGGGGGGRGGDNHACLLKVLNISKTATYLKYVSKRLPL